MAENKKQSPRDVAWRCAQRWARGGAFAETLLRNEAASLSMPDRALAQAIIYGLLRNLRWLEHLCGKLRSAHMEDSARWLALVGLCQLFILKQPEHAAVSETVKLAPTRMRGLINGILRNAVRRRQEFEQERDTLPLGIRFSTPDWLAERWVAELGAEETARMLEWNIQSPPVYVRLNPLNKIVPPPDWQPLAHADGWFRLPGGLPLEALHMGQVYAADPSTRYSIDLLSPKAGEKVLDACAAPGGKAVAILGATGGEADLVATDAAAHRLPQLRENLLRAGGRHVHVARQDWARPCPPAYKEAFDAVLLDVPCSNSGVLQRRVDARWRLAPQEFARLAALQAQILENASDAVKPGGRLAYSTCSVDRQENRGIVDAFLARHPEFRLKEDYLALPHREQADGAYAALLCRD